DRGGAGTDRAPNWVRSLSPLGERVGVRGLPAVLIDPNPLTQSLFLQQRVALSPAGRGHNRRQRGHAARGRVVIARGGVVSGRSAGVIRPAANSGGSRCAFGVAAGAGG